MVNQLAESPDGTVWMAETTRAVRPLKRPGEALYQGLTKGDCQSRFPDTWQTEPTCRRPDDLEVRVGSAGILFDRNGSFWITTVEDGLRRAPYPLQLPREPIGKFSNVLEQFTSQDGLSSDFATLILEDREGNIWVATRDGLDQFRNSALAPVILRPAATQLSIAADQRRLCRSHSMTTGNLFRFHDAHNRTPTPRRTWALRCSIAILRLRSGAPDARAPVPIRSRRVHRSYGSPAPISANVRDPAARGRRQSSAVVFCAGARSVRLRRRTLDALWRRIT